MAKGVFVARRSSRYDDLIEHRYHFPNRLYRSLAEQLVRDWVIYYEPDRLDREEKRRGGRKAYFAAAFVERLVPDPDDPSHSYAYVSNFMEFPRPVPLSEGGIWYEQSIAGLPPIKLRDRSVRTLEEVEFQTILAAGLAQPLGEPPEAGEAEIVWSARPIHEVLLARRFRDRTFRQVVRRAYGDTCAFTGLRMINGGGRPEIEAAHIMPVADEGPDSVRNGLALSRTFHWMFDRHLVSLEDDGAILLAEGLVPPAVSRMIRPEGRILLPGRETERPHPMFLAQHRERHFAVVPARRG